jgi:hypothetical protein
MVTTALELAILGFNPDPDKEAEPCTERYDHPGRSTSLPED